MVKKLVAVLGKLWPFRVMNKRVPNVKSQSPNKTFANRVSNLNKVKNFKGKLRREQTTTRTLACKNRPYMVGITQNYNTCNKKIEVKPVTELDDGNYLYVIERDSGGKFVVRFSPVHDYRELGSRHFLIPNYNKPNSVILAAGELRKEGTRVRFNLESGTIMRRLMNIYKNSGVIKPGQNIGVINFVREVLEDQVSKNSSYSVSFTREILVPGQTNEHSGNKLKNAILNALNRPGVSLNALTVRPFQFLTKNALQKIKHKFNIQTDRRLLEYMIHGTPHVKNIIAKEMAGEIALHVRQKRKKRIIGLPPTRIQPVRVKRRGVFKFPH
jgi:hypothetical protein